MRSLCLRAMLIFPLYFLITIYMIVQEGKCQSSWEGIFLRHRSLTDGKGMAHFCCMMLFTMLHIIMLIYIQRLRR